MITSRRNERIKTIRDLRRCKGEYAFLEGPHLVEEMLSTGLDWVEVLVTPEFLERAAGRSIAERLARPPLEVTASVLSSITDASSPQGVLAVARLPRAGVESLPLLPGGVYLFLDRIQDPGNLGAIVRSAEATSVAGIALSPGCAHPNNPKALRASGGSLLRLPIATGVGLEPTVVHLAEVAPRLVAVDSNRGGDLYETELEGALLLAFGSEGAGLDRELDERADLRITIPVSAPVESLNVTVAASVVLHELARRRRQPAKRLQDT